MKCAYEKMPIVGATEEITIFARREVFGGVAKSVVKGKGCEGVLGGKVNEGGDLAKYVNKRVAYRDIPAKIDTGAASSAVWASGIRVDGEGVLHFCLFGEGSPYYNGVELSRKDYTVGVVRSSNGQEELRYRVGLTLEIEGKRVKALVSLANRERNRYPVLVGRRTLSGKFLVDVSKGEVKSIFEKYNMGLRKEMEKDPVKFYQEWMQGGDLEELRKRLEK